MKEQKRVILKKGKEDLINKRHPWLFSGAIDLLEDTLEEGDLVEVQDYKQEFLAIGHYQIGSIAVRLLEFEKKEIDKSYWIKRISEAIQLRKDLGLLNNEDTTIFRLIHAEGDGLPGLIIDVYAQTAVIQCHSIGMWNVRQVIADSIVDLLPTIQSVYDKSAETLPFKASISPKNGYLIQKEPPLKIAKEYNCQFAIDWETGQKTGFFIDQRENRKLLGKLSAGKKVLNTFCYSGGFSIFALLNGAKEVHSLDSSQKAIDLVERNLDLIPEYKEKHKSIVADAVPYIKNLKEQYDIIILDPPAFAKHKESRHKALQAYQRLNERAMEQLTDGGLLFTFSCSQVVTKELFNHMIVAAAMNVKKKVRILYQLHQPADHPINVFHPESEYLKGLVLQIV
jgi:23S rRNA (cytosine1962-C5)-methyltransferase